MADMGAAREAGRAARLSVLKSGGSEVRVMVGSPLAIEWASCSKARRSNHGKTKFEVSQLSLMLPFMLPYQFILCGVDNRLVPTRHGCVLTANQFLVGVCPGASCIRTPGNYGGGNSSRGEERHLPDANQVRPSIV